MSCESVVRPLCSADRCVGRQESSAESIELESLRRRLQKQQECRAMEREARRLERVCVASQDPAADVCSMCAGCTGAQNR